ncbi:MAG: hypothetical protein OEZ39_02450 [Gammaproteobacteria bacterium]|nr:hypothetical protein [Gammaproteobacteria bacterium]MDH5650715.1 hypothetical protein [Gammaproteobacteria bacterium]
MKSITVAEGIGMAVVLSLAGAAAFSLFIPTNLIIAGLALGYVCYLLLRTKERIGRVSVIVLWAAVTAAVHIFSDSAMTFLLIQLLMIWLVRALYFYHGVIPALMDLGLSGLAMSAAVWAWLNTHSLLATIWCFFLVQALFVLIPKKLAGKANTGEAEIVSADRFDRAHKVAELAVRKLTQIH